MTLRIMPLDIFFIELIWIINLLPNKIKKIILYKKKNQQNQKRLWYKKIYIYNKIIQI